MFLFTLAFLAGDVCLQQLSKLPSPSFLLIILLLSLVLHLCLHKRISHFYLITACILGFTWSAWQAHQILSWSLSPDLQVKPLIISGEIASLPAKDKWGQRFLFSLDRLQNLDLKDRRLLLSWQDDSQQLKVGESWQLKVKLKSIHGLQNPGTSDYEAWAFQNGIRAKGYVINSSDNRRMSSYWYHHPIDQLRQRLRDKIASLLPASPNLPWLSALMLGDHSGATSADWKILRQTGTNHLMAIAGLHIAMLAAFVHLAVSWLWRRSTYLMLHCPVKLAGAASALLVASFYSLLAGFSLPTRRACFMLVLLIIILLMRRKLAIWHIWASVLLIELLFNPLSVLSESFWLSFVSIALIIYGMQGRLAPRGWWWKWGRVQWVLALGLMPMTLFFFQETSLISFAANCAAIPWLEFCIMPFCVLSSIFLFIIPPLGKLLLYAANYNLSILWIILTWFSHYSFASWQHAITSYSVFFSSIIAIILLLMPRGAPGRCLSIVWLLPLYFYQTPWPNEGDVWFTLLDVGQGLSAVIQTQTHLLIYDAGSSFYQDMGERVLVPYLHSIQARKVDMLVISHGDNDHIGGASSLLAAMPVLSIKTSVPEKIKTAVTDYCSSGMSWQWDKVRFTFLYPAMDHLGLSNDSSCVLRIDNGVQSILLTGDIEKQAETALLKQNASALRATILVAPHHGSKTSCSRKFVAAVHPSSVLYATGYLNRYHFPHPSVVSAYQSIHAAQFNTALSGSIEYHLGQAPILYRRVHARYWQDKA